MKDTCVVKVDGDWFAHFYPRDSGSDAYVLGWPTKLAEKFEGPGIYSIQRVKRAIRTSVRVDIVGEASMWPGDDILARFTRPCSYGICTRFLTELGVTPPPKGKQKTLHLVVTKRRAKK